MNPILLAALTVSTIALALASYALLDVRRCRRALKHAERLTSDLWRRVEFLERVIGKALEAIDEIDEARRLKRRRRRRYIAALIVYEGRLPPDPREAAKSIEEALRRLGGELGVAEARPTIVYYDPVRGAMVVRTNHLAVNLVLAALALVRQIGGAKARIIPLRTTGTIRSARRALGVLDKLPSRAG